MAISSPSCMHQPAVAGRIGRAEAEHGDRRAIARARRAAAPASAAGSAACRRKRPGRRRRRARSRLARGQHRMGGAAPLRLHEDLRASAATPLRFGRDRVALRARPRRRSRCRPPRGPRRAHAPAATGRRRRAAPSGAPSACGCPRRRRARWQGRCAQASIRKPSEPASVARRRHIRAGRAGKGGMRRSSPLPRKRPNLASANVLDALNSPMGIRLWRYGLWLRDPRARAFNMRALWRLRPLGHLGGRGAHAGGGRRLFRHRLAALDGGRCSAGRHHRRERAPAAATPQPVARSSETEAETRRLAEAVRALTADRERLAARLGTLERSLEDVTGAIKQQATAASPPPTAPPRRAAAPAAPRQSQEAALTPAVGGRALLPSRRPPCPGSSRNAASRRQGCPGGTGRRSCREPRRSRPGRTFGVDIGGAPNFDGLRVLWSSTRGGNAALFEALATGRGRAREQPRRKVVELRLVAGPLANAEAAARICATLVVGAALLPARRLRRPAAGAGRRACRNASLSR